MTMIETLQARADQQANSSAAAANEILSFRGRRWVTLPIDIDNAKSLLTIGLSRPMAAVLAARGFDNITAKPFLNTSIDTFLPPDGYIKDLDVAVDRIARAAAFGENVTVWGDYDVDGATSSAIMTRTLRAAGANVEIHIPDRIKDGYGPNTAGLLALKESGADLVIIVDSGTTAFDQLAAAKKVGLDCVVIDHHAAEPTLPEAVAVVNPNRQDQEPGYGHMCAAGVAWLVARQVAAKLGLGLDFADGLLDIAALGTVCDVVSLTTINRAIVRRGLELMQSSNNQGIRALKIYSEVKGDVDAYHLGYLLGPRINAGGRIGESWMGAHLLSSDDHDECMRLADNLTKLNDQRKHIEQLALAEAQEMAAEQTDRPSIMVVGDWHEGIIGIIAGRIKETTDKPVFVFSKLETPGANGEILAKGSARSMPDFDLGEVVIKARQDGVLAKGGGHAMAAGATLDLAKFDEFRDRIETAVLASKFAKIGPFQKVDCAMHPGLADIPFIMSLETMEPFGQGNPKPRFLMRAVRLRDVAMIGNQKQHLRAKITRQGAELSTILFKAVGTPLGEGIMGAEDRPLDLVVTLGINEYNGRRTAQAMIEDARIAVIENVA